MPNEMTAAEIAEKLENMASDAASIRPDQDGKYKLVDITLHVLRDIKLLRSAADFCRRVASGELKPVVHGKWEYDTNPKDGDIRCTHCGIAWPKCEQDHIAKQGIWTLQTLFKYCPSCGALMDGKDGSHETN